MPRRKREASDSFASVYDALYDEPVFLAARTSFLLTALAPCDGLLLDAGCGTGGQAAELRARGRSVIGLDSDPLMLAVARAKRPGLPLARGDLRRLPFRAAFSGILCLESPLAYLLDDADFALALRSLRRALLRNGRLIVETYDYVTMFWPRALGRMRAEVGPIRVVESHDYDERTRVWTMRQRFAVDEEGRIRRFEVTHRLKMRTPDEYASALEEAGFGIVEMLAEYPGLPERRIIAVAEAR